MRQYLYDLLYNAVVSYIMHTFPWLSYLVQGESHIRMLFQVVHPRLEVF